MSPDSKILSGDDRVFEKIKTTHLVYPSTLISIFIFVVTFSGFAWLFSKESIWVWSIGTLTRPDFS